MKNRKFYNILFWGIIFSLICFIPYLTKSSNLLESDIVYHLSRIEGLANSIKETGNFFPKIYNSLFYEQGYAFPMFYCDLFLIIPALLYNAGLSLITSYKLLILVCNFCTFLSFYTLLNKFKLKIIWCYIFSGLYLFSYYRLYDLYFRASLGEIIAFIFLPIALKGIYELIYEDNNKLLNNSIIIGYTGLALSHNVSLYLASILFALFLLLNIFKLNLKKIKQLICTTIVAILLSSWYIFPMFEQMMHINFTVSNQVNNFLSSFVDIQDSLFILGNVGIFSDRIGDLLLIVSIILFIYDFKSIKKTFVFQTYILGFILIIFTLDGFQFIAPLFEIIQFSSRFYLLSTLLLSFSCCMSLYKMLESKLIIEKLISYSRYLLVLVIATFIITYFVNDSLLVVMGLQSKGIFLDSTTTYEEILNSQMAKERCFSDKLCLDSGIDDLYLDVNFENEIDNQNFKLISRIGSNYQFIAENDLSNGQYTLPIVYYYGYDGYYEDNKCGVLAGNGRVSILISNGIAKGTIININYQETMITKITKTISAITLLGYGIYLMKVKNIV